MPVFLETTVDKFTFKVATDRFYSDEGVWAKEEGGQVPDWIDRFCPTA